MPKAMITYEDFGALSWSTTGPCPVPKVWMQKTIVSNVRADSKVPVW
jgi:hypothetical protein